MESHYVRKTATCQYLPPELSIKEMHRLNGEYCIENDLEIQSYDFYKRVFNRRFRLKFHKPKKDDCNHCTSFKNLHVVTEEQKIDHQKHLSGKKYTRKLKTDQKEASNNETVATAAFDLQQVLLSPYDPTGSFYYSRRLKSHNLTVTEIDNMTTYAYLWSEHEAAKGSCEVSTGVLKFLQEKKKRGERIY